MYNFFVESKQITGNIVEIINDDYKHISKVLRMAIKEKLSICNKESGERFLAEIISINKEKVICNIIEKFESNEMKVDITIYQGIPKSDKMEYIIQKSVELGAKKIVPVEMKNCIAKVKDTDKKIVRWKSISESAAKQSKRNIIPEITRPINIKDLCSVIKQHDLVLVAYENEKNSTIKELLKNNRNVKNIAVIIGPEGGLTQTEVDSIIENGGISISLGHRILRTETASIVILSMIMYEFDM